MAAGTGDERWMQRCLQLAAHGAGHAAPNPMVGAVLVRKGLILSEGWHHERGRPHAEVECLHRYGAGAIPQDAILYVSLEPCVHTGLTPPCTDLIIRRHVRTVVVGCTDPNPKVAGKGLARMRKAGIQVTAGVLEEACRWQDRRFLTAMEHQRPYVILKWARSSDGFLDANGAPARISCVETDVRVHRWRSEEQAILVGSRTVLNDNPRLTTRLVAGRSPLRVVLDRKGATPAGARIFDGSAPTLLFSGSTRSLQGIDQVVLPDDRRPLAAIMAELHARQIRSVLVEGGAQLLGHFLEEDLWDEVREIVGPGVLVNGTRAPRMQRAPQRSIVSGADRIHFHFRSDPPIPGHAW